MSLSSQNIKIEKNKRKQDQKVRVLKKIKNKHYHHHGGFSLYIEAFVKNHQIQEKQIHSSISSNQ